ncbi:MAG: xanthine dehydrogenase family protein subunit M, partial [Spirochaetes bacterium]|nr:xanthine dehydrogenase family protein subunit M [Spirochaetota bacterium]
PEVIIDLKGIGELKNIEEKGNFVKIGAGVTFTDIIQSDLLKKVIPALVEASQLVASVGVRNTATMVGNICNAVPSADSAAPLLVRDAEVKINSANGERTVPITGFFSGPRKTVLKPDEIVSAVSFQKEKAKFGEVYLKLGRYRGEDLAQVGVSVFVDTNLNYKVAYAAVGPVPLRIATAEAILRGRKPAADLVEQACLEVEKKISPIDDIRASKAYRLHMCRVMLEKGVEAAFSRMEKNTPAYGTKLI